MKSVKGSLTACVIFFCVWFVLSNSYAERNLLTGQLSEEDLAEMLVSQKEFQIFPAYRDLEFWENLPEFYRQGLMTGRTACGFE